MPGAKKVNTCAARGCYEVVPRQGWKCSLHDHAAMTDDAYARMKAGHEADKEARRQANQILATQEAFWSGLDAKIRGRHP